MHSLNKLAPLTIGKEVVAHSYNPVSIRGLGCISTLLVVFEGERANQVRF